MSGAHPVAGATPAPPGAAGPAPPSPPPAPDGDAHARRSVLRNASTVGGLTMLSRVLGFVREIIMARQLGLGSGADAFYVAWQLPNLFRKLFGEGALSAAFVPVFVEEHERGKPEEAKRLAWASTNRLAIGLTALVVALEALSWVARIETTRVLAGEAGWGIASRFSRASLEHADLALALSQILLPYLVLICVSGLLTGALNALDHFAAPAAAPSILNVVWIAALFVGPRYIHDPTLKVQALSWVLLGGGAIQLAMHVGAMHSLGLPFQPAVTIEAEKLARMRRHFYSVVVGLAVFQVNTFVDSMIAFFFIPEGGGVSALNYANRLTQLPIGTVGISVATAIFPELSRLVARKDSRAFYRTMDEAMGASFFIALPCAVGLAALAEPIVRVLFERGEFDHAATVRTANVLLAFSAAVAAGCISPTITRAFYAEQDTRTPVRVSVWAVVVNFGLNLALVGPLKEAGLALATAISQTGQLVALYAIQVSRRRKAGCETGLAVLGVALARSSVLCLALGLAARGTWVGLASLLGGTFERHGAVRMGSLGVAIGAGGLVYLGLAWVAGAPELTALLGIRARRRGGKPGEAEAAAGQG